MATVLPAYEKLATFYLGRIQDLAGDRTTDDLVLYDAKDLTTHAICVGMTGSGKTGLCLSLLEEAAIDGVPAIAIDPKGDLGNLLLAFPELRPEDFRPWIEPEEAARKGQTVEAYAKTVAQTWSKGLAQWDQDGERIRRYRDAVDLAIYTPGSQAGLPLCLLQSLAAPPPALLADGDLLRERTLATVSGLLALLGIEADPVRSREHILLATLLDRAWRAGRDLELSDLIREIQQPPLERIGVIDLESFFPAKDRFGLAMTLNNLLASPGFQVWREGEPLDVQRLLWTSAGKPRLSILSIAHLGDAERMFFVTLLLGEVVSWMRTQSGSSSLRAILYMDEVFGFLPPTANPPSKVPMLTLLKQARAFGLGVVLATQNPVDLDYKALSNAGTWFLGRLQTERDKARVLEGLEGASATAGQAFDRGRTEQILAGLKSRVFYMNNVHEDRPTIFHTRWALSYLRGPLTRTQIKSLMDARRAGAAPVPQSPPAEAPVPATPASAGGERPLAPPDVPEAFLGRARSLPADATLVYRPALLGTARVRYASAKHGIDHAASVAFLAPLDEGDAPSNPWEGVVPLSGGAPRLERDPDGAARFVPPPSEALQTKRYGVWARALAEEVIRSHPLVVFRHPGLEATSRPGEGEGDFRARLAQRDRERRDLELVRLRAAWAPKLARLQDRIRKAEHRVDAEQEQYHAAKTGAIVSLGSTILGALFGRRKISAGTIQRAGTTIRGKGRADSQREDVARARDNVRALQQELQALEADLARQVEGLETRIEPATLALETVAVRPKKTDVDVAGVHLAWVPFALDAQGRADPLFP